MIACRQCNFKVAVEGHHSANFPYNCLDEAAEPADAITPAEVVVLLYYSYVEIHDIPDALQWHEKIALHTGLNGRIRISPEGLNVVLDGLRQNIELYIDAVK